MSFIVRPTGANPAARLGGRDRNKHKDRKKYGPSYITQQLDAPPSGDVTADGVVLTATASIPASSSGGGAANLIHNALTTWGTADFTITDPASGDGAVTVDSPAAGDITIDPDTLTSDTVILQDAISVSANALVLDGSYLRFRIKSNTLPTTAGGNHFQVYVRSRASPTFAFYRIEVASGTLTVASYRAGTTTTRFTTTFSSTDHAWMEITAASGNTSFKTSSNSGESPSNWTTQATWANDADVVGDSRVEIRAYQANFAGPKGQIVLSGLNYAGSPLATGDASNTSTTLSSTASQIDGTADGGIVSQDGDATGATIAVAASQTDGTAGGDAVNSATTISSAASQIDGVVTGEASTSSLTISVAASQILGSAAGDSSASSVTLDVTGTQTAGAATGEASNSATVISAAASALVGSAAGTADAASEILSTSTALVDGSSNADALADGSILSLESSLDAGSTTADAQTSSVAVTSVASQIDGAAEAAASAEGTALEAIISLVDGSIEADWTTESVLLSADTAIVSSGASGSNNIPATASGTTLTLTAEQIDGSVMTDSSVDGVIIEAVSSISGEALGDGGYDSITFDAVVSLVPGAADTGDGINRIITENGEALVFETVNDAILYDDDPVPYDDVIIDENGNPILDEHGYALSYLDSSIIDAGGDTLVLTTEHYVGHASGNADTLAHLFPIATELVNGEALVDVIIDSANLSSIASLVDGQPEADIELGSQNLDATVELLPGNVFSSYTSEDFVLYSAGLLYGGAARSNVNTESIILSRAASLIEPQAFAEFIANGESFTTSSEILPGSVRLSADTQPATIAASTFLSSGVSADWTVDGQSLQASSWIVPGEVVIITLVEGASLGASTQLIPGTVELSASTSPVTISAAASVNGSVSADSAIPGQLLSSSAFFSPGQVLITVYADGASLLLSTSLADGSAAGQASAAGELLGRNATLNAGIPVINASADGAQLSSTVSFTPAAAFVSVTTEAAILERITSLFVGTVDLTAQTNPERLISHTVFLPGNTGRKSGGGGLPHKPPKFNIPDRMHRHEVEDTTLSVHFRIKYNGQQLNSSFTTSSNQAFFKVGNVTVKPLPTRYDFKISNIATEAFLWSPTILIRELEIAESE